MAEQLVPNGEMLTEDIIGEDENTLGLNNNSLALLQNFIEMYESLPVLWNSRLQEYKSKVKRNKALLQLLECYKQINPESTIGDVKKKINSLRSNYRKDLKKIIQSKRSGAGTDEVYEPTSWVFYALRFLGESEIPMNMEIPQAHNVTQETPSEVETELNDQEMPQLTSIGQFQPSRSSIEPTIIAPPPIKKKKTLGLVAKQNELLSLACKYLSSSSNEDKADDEYLNIAKVWANKMKTLQPNQRMFAEKAINDVLFEAQLGTLDKNSVKINELDRGFALYAPTSNSTHASSSPLLLEVPPTEDSQDVRYVFSQFDDN